MEDDIDIKITYGISYLMENQDIVAFTTWSAITAIFLIVVSLVYRRFKMKKVASSSH